MKLSACPYWATRGAHWHPWELALHQCLVKRNTARSTGRSTEVLRSIFCIGLAAGATRALAQLSVSALESVIRNLVTR